MMLTVDQILVGACVEKEVEVPSTLLPPGKEKGASWRVVLRPLAVRDLQRINRAAKNDDSLSAALMIQAALVKPAVKTEQAAQMSAGLASFLVDQINALSGISTPRNQLDEMVQAPLARACFVLAKEFGWTPEEVSGMTIGQILLYLEMSRRDGESK
jgi:hypothetical protein